MRRALPKARLVSSRTVEFRRPVAAGTGEAVGSIGHTIRVHRKKAGLTLQDVAHEAECSISYLSQIERNLLVPSVGTLRRIATILSIPLGQLAFGDGGSGIAPVGVVRRNERKRLVFPGSNIDYQLLTPDMRRRSSLLWVKAPPGSESGPAFSHEGEDGVLVLAGTLEIEIGDVWHQLDEGDSIYFNAELPHRWRNRGTKTAEAIWVSSPPAF
ncbi:helix-turn-helix domain-containing protein [Roseomonas chloroacetimidivorans]|uniref:helix-turn-helix domain-containing protein n=1 Tax=Roseomonas chloroacetimidivorans TaxID=1766656 RepID=UPI003C721C8D